MQNKSLLGTKIGRSGEILRKSAFSQIDDYQKKFATVGSFYEPLFKDLMVDSFDPKDAAKTAKELFDKETVNFVAIDGTVYSKHLFDMIIFFAGSYSCEGTMSFSDKGVGVKYNERFMDDGRDISSCVPIFVNKVPEIDQTFLEVSEDDIEAVKPVTDEIIVNNTNIDNFLMTFSEFYLAYQLAKSGRYDVIFLDRSISNMYSSLIYDTSKRKLWETHSSIVGYIIDGQTIDINDITIARQHIVNEKLKLPAPRGDYLRYAILNLLKQKDKKLTFEEICKNLSLDDEKKKSRAEKYLKKSVSENLVEEADETYNLAPKYKTTWDRIAKLVDSLGKKIFSEDDPFILEKNGEKQWITTLDLAFLTLFSLNLLVEECWQRNILLIGMTKDTTAREFKNHVVPICINNKIWPSKLTQEQLDAIPNTDRMLLQSLSMHNHEKICPPWALIEYDSAFVMAVPDFEKRFGYVSGAVQNKITPSRLFLRSFVQLDQAKFDKKLRSNVLAIDRMVYPKFDLEKDATTEFIHEYSAQEPIKFILYKNNKIKNPIQNLVITILKSMSSPSIPEAFGHNKALYIADKVAKWHNEQFRKIVESTGTLILNNKSSRDFVFYMNTFRERREDFESSRK
jgi:hypothetical protein